MSIAYVIENFINVDTLHSVSSEDPSGFYDKKRLYMERPSWPLRFEGKGSMGPPVPEWICIDHGEDKRITFAGIFNHNLTATPERFCLKGCVSACGVCDWEAAPAWEEDMRGRILSNTFADHQFIFPNSHKWIERGQRYQRFEFIDTTNPDGYIEIGEAVLGTKYQFASTVYLQPGRPDGPIFHMGNQQTPYGQDHPNYYSYDERFVLKFMNINDVRIQDEVQMFLIRVQQNGGRFILIPDDEVGLYPADYIPRCYYVIIENKRDYANRLVHGWSNELREWGINLKTLTMGLKLK